MGDEPLTYAAPLLSLRQFVNEHHGADGWQQLQGVLAQLHGIELPSVIGAHRWLPTRWFTASMNAGRDLFGPADFHLRFGAAAAEYEMSWVHRVALRFTSPLWLLERGAEYWGRAHDTGRWEVEGRTGFIRGTLRDFGIVDGGYCDSLRAWLTRACSMTGAGRVYVVERQCRARAAPDAVGSVDGCIFEGTW